MEKLFKKGMIVISCGAVLALGGAALCVRGGLQADASALPSANRILLDAGQGALSETSVELTNEGTLPALPTPVRDGWEFIGWYDGEVIENFWGDEAEENAGADDDYKLLKKAYATSGYQNVLYQGEVVPVEQLSDEGDRGWKELTFNWICMTKGNKVQEGCASEGITTLYAMYRAERYTVHWHLNGWKNTYDAEKAMHRTMPEQGGYFVNYKLDEFPSLYWENHEFLGWYLDAACTQEYTFRQVGAYQINESPAKGELHLYAKWTSLKPFDGEIYFKKLSNLVEPKLNATFSVNCSYSLGASRDMPVITQWESSEPEAVEVVSCNAATASAQFIIRDTAMFQGGNKLVTVYVWVDGTRYPVAELTIGHSWGGIVKEMAPTCTQAGYTVYGCKFCEETKRVQHAADGHRLVQTDHPATCTEDAYSEIDCIVCGLHEMQTIPDSKLGHSLQTTVIADCSGTTTITSCIRCALTETVFDADAVVHSWDSHFTTDKPATCVEEGVQSVHCISCGARGEERILPATGEHSWGEWHIDQEATDTESGSRSRVCAVCGETQEESIPPVPEVKPEVEPEPALPGEEKTEESFEEVSAVFSAEKRASAPQTEERQASRLWLIALAAIPLLGAVLAVLLVTRRNRKAN